MIKQLSVHEEATVRLFVPLLFKAHPLHKNNVGFIVWYPDEFNSSIEMFAAISFWIEHSGTFAGWIEMV